MALEDVYVLSNLLSLCSTPADIVTAFDAYDFVRVPRTLKVIFMSRAQGKTLDLEGAAGDDLEKIAELLNTEVRWIWNEDLPAHLAKAIKKFEDAKASTSTYHGPCSHAS